MQTQTSLLGNIIISSPASKDMTLDALLSLRFEEGEVLEKNLENLHDPYLMCDMQKAVDRIKTAKEKKEKVIIF